MRGNLFCCFLLFSSSLFVLTKFNLDRFWGDLNEFLAAGWFHFGGEGLRMTISLTALQMKTISEIMYLDIFLVSCGD